MSDGMLIGPSDAAAKELREHALVVSHSRITRVVVTEIVQRTGLRAVSEEIEPARVRLRNKCPQLLILDGGPDNHACDSIIDDIVAVQHSNEDRLPRVIMLSSRVGTVEELGLSAAIDGVVAKPITPERLQPAIERLVRRKG